MLQFISTLIIVQMLFAPASAYVVDRVEAVVDGSVITKSDVDRALEEAWRAEKDAGKEKSALRKEVLDALIDRRLLLNEARKFNLVQVTDKEVQDAFDSMKAKYPSEDEFKAALAREEMTEDDLKDDIRDQILAVKYVDRRVRFFVRVTLDEQRKYYEQHKDSFGDKSFGDVQEGIYNLLVEQKTTQKMDDYIKGLRDKSQITLFGQP